MQRRFHRSCLQPKQPLQSANRSDCQSWLFTKHFCRLQLFHLFCYPRLRSLLILVRISEAVLEVSCMIFKFQDVLMRFVVRFYQFGKLLSSWYFRSKNYFKWECLDEADEVDDKITSIVRFDRPSTILSDKRRGRSWSDSFKKIEPISHGGYADSSSSIQSSSTSAPVSALKAKQERLKKTESLTLRPRMRPRLPRKCSLPLIHSAESQ